MTPPDPSEAEHRPALGPITYTFSPTLPAIRLARHVLANWLELLPGVDVDGIDDLLIAGSELVTNAVRHATGPSAAEEISITRRGSATPSR